MRTFNKFHVPINLDLNRRCSRKGNKPLQLGNLLFQICVKSQTRAMMKNNEHVVQDITRSR